MEPISDLSSIVVATDHQGPKTKQMDIASLMSPPEQFPLDNFSSTSSVQLPSLRETRERITTFPHPVQAPATPPISPVTNIRNVVDGKIASPGTDSQKDPILYPSSDASSSPQQPLFGTNNAPRVAQFRPSTAQQNAANLDMMFRMVDPEQLEAAQTLTMFRSTAWERYRKNPKQWLLLSLRQLKADRDARIQARRPLAASRPSSTSSTPIKVRTKPSKVEKIARRPLRAAPPARALAPHSPTGPRQSVASRQPGTPPEARARAAPASREDKEFFNLPNYCPSTDDLPHNTTLLKVDWKGTPLDLSNDPNRGLLHPAEINLAASLRLDCATYLTSKRRIFEAMVKKTAEGKGDFRKTDAQQACHIDVNKASRLHAAFSKVGWLKMPFYPVH
jgi:hypothetical protein